MTGWGSSHWWAWTVSNRRHLPCKPGGQGRRGGTQVRAGPQCYREGGLEWNEDALVFPKDDGEQRDSTNVFRNFRSLLKEAGFTDPKEWTTRELRTSFVSVVSDHGIPIEVISRVVGHSGSATTERVYRKQLRPLIAGGAEAMDDIFEPRTHSKDAPGEG
ncbi:tyrosine-type recombinase/integrase [Streptomyces sp. NPDC059718]